MIESAFAPSSGGLMLCRPVKLLCPGDGVFLHSDPHIGSPQTNERLIIAELDQAAERGDRIAINGDLFDGILAADAKRYRPNAVARYLQGNNDIVGGSIDRAVKIYSPYASLIDMVGSGNHDETLVKHHSFCPVSEFLKRLQTFTKHQIWYGGYTGFLRYGLERSARQRAGHRAGDFLTIFYWHGAGGGTSLGSSLSEFAGKGTFVEGANVHWFAHKHVRLACPVQKVSCSRRSEMPRTRTLWYVRTAAYMQSYRGQSQDSWRARGRKGNYAADSLYSPAGPGGMRIVIGERGVEDLRVEFTVP